MPSKIKTLSPHFKEKEALSHGTAAHPIEGLCFDLTQPHPNYPDHFYVERHWHPEVEILYAFQGDFHININLQDYEMSSGDICLIGSGDLHTITGCEDATIHKVLLFNENLLDFSYNDEFQISTSGPLLQGRIRLPHFIRPADEGYDQIAPLFAECMDRAIVQKEDWYFECKLLLLRIIHLMQVHNLLPEAGKFSSADEKIERYKQISSYIDDHLSEPVTLNDLASIAGCSREYFCRFFREISGQPPVQYLISRRIERACLLLSQTSMSILEISMECGFDNVSYFIRKFRQQKGSTPGEYRRALS